MDSLETILCYRDLKINRKVLVSHGNPKNVEITGNWNRQLKIEIPTNL